jgi:hypothetical protein
MTVATAPGTFYCPSCDTVYPDSIEDKHRLAHGEASPLPRTSVGLLGSPPVFYAYCLATGGLAAAAAHLIALKLHLL